MSKEPRRRVRVPRQIAIGSARPGDPGATLDCVVLEVRDEEWIGVHLDTGAFVRVVGAIPVQAPPGLFSVVRVTIAKDGEPSDPARPELLTAAPELEELGVVRLRRLRRLFDTLVVGDRPGAPLLGTRGPSLAYVDLDGTSPSLVMISAKGSDPELAAVGEGAQLGINFGGVRQQLPVVERRSIATARRARGRRLRGSDLVAELGFRPGYLLIGLDTVQDGHVRKVALQILPRNLRRRATSGGNRRRDPRPSPSRS